MYANRRKAIDRDGGFRGCAQAHNAMCLREEVGADAAERTGEERKRRLQDGFRKPEPVDLELHATSTIPLATTSQRGYQGLQLPLPSGRTPADWENRHLGGGEN